MLSRPANRRDLHMPDLLSLTLKGRNFILGDNGLDDKTLIFGTQLYFIKCAQLKLFLFTLYFYNYILSTHFYVVFPGMYALLPNKIAATMQICKCI